LSPLTPGGSYVVTPSKSALAPGAAGINTVDVLAIQADFLGFESLSQGCQRSAADVNGDTFVDTIDAIAIQRFFLGFTTRIGNTGNSEFIPPSRAYLGISSDETGQDYGAFIHGDVLTPFADQSAANPEP